MPNYVRNIIEFSTTATEKEIERLFKSILTQSSEKNDGSSFFDFNQLIPMPKALEIEEGTTTNMGMLLYRICQTAILCLGNMAETVINAKKYEDVFVSKNMNELVTEYRRYMREFHPDICTDTRATEITQKLNALYEQAKKHMDMRSRETREPPKSIWDAISDKSWKIDSIKREIAEAGYDPENLESVRSFSETAQGRKLYEIGRIACDNVRLYGYRSWYDWRCIHWGTKWNSNTFEVNQKCRVIKFDTAWGAPFPVAEALAKRFPTIDFDWTYADEDYGYNTGRIRNRKGDFEIEIFESCSDAAYETYAECWGVSIE